MTERAFKIMGNAGAANIVVGIVTIVVGVAAGVVLLIGGAKLLSSKKGLTF